MRVAGGHSGAYRRVVLTLAQRSFSLAGGGTRSVRLQLSARALALLERSGVLSTRAAFALHGATATISSTSAPLTLRLAPASRAPTHG
ncbi:MAG TPA: hypothetical protein VH081_07750 [Solirubrobacteraceae bacterium]|nr:hypothetical protein [Solirubrobacteraceae bacterium]